MSSHLLKVKVDDKEYLMGVDISNNDADTVVIGRFIDGKFHIEECYSGGEYNAR